jgi:hypothetical protein
MLLISDGLDWLIHIIATITVTMFLMVLLRTHLTFDSSHSTFVFISLQVADFILQM